MSYRTQVRAEATDPDCLDDDAAAALLAGAPWRRFAVAGDSIAQGVGDLSPGYRPIHWPLRVAAALHAACGAVNYLNTGKRGATSREVVDEQTELLVAFRPDLLFVAAGGNDLWTRRPDYPGIAANLDELFSAGTRSGARLVAMTIADTPLDPALGPLRERLSLLNDEIRALAARHDAILVELWQHPVGYRPGILSTDNIHFTVEGHAVVAAEVVKALAAAKN